MVFSENKHSMGIDKKSSWIYYDNRQSSVITLLTGLRIRGCVPFILGCSFFYFQLSKAVNVYDWEAV